MGYEASPPDPIPEMIREVIDQVGQFCEIQGGYRIFDSFQRDKKNHTITLDHVTFHVKPTVSNLIRKAEMAAVFVCTAGPDVIEWSKKFMSDGDLMKGYVVDVAGSEIVERAMDKIQMALEEDMKEKGFGITDRYSPGYCDWNVAEQKKLFSLLPENYCGISLSESSLMYPIKSVSGIIGIGKNAERKGYTCDFCNMRDCVYRKRKTHTSHV